MELVIKFSVLYFSFSIFVIATCWYIAPIIEARWPDWWRRVIVDIDPDSFNQEGYPNW